MSDKPEPSREFREAAPAVMPMASAASRWERIKLTAMAVLGIAVYYLVLATTFALLLLANPWSGYYGPWPIVAILVFFWWTLQPYRETPGEPVSRARAPALFANIESLADQLGAPRIDEVRLTNDFNAGALEVAARWQPWRKRRLLILGVPLLALTDAATVRGVIAHELGHFSHRHGRLGQWIYRARAGWVSYAAEPMSSYSLLERGAAFFAHWFAPRFSRLSFNYSRQCEYEADAYGAAIVGRVNMAAGLLTITIFGERWDEMTARELPRLIAAQDTPPPAWMAHVQQHLHTQAPQADEFERLRVKLSDPHDTHPSTSERMQALGVGADEALRACRLPQQVAGATWLLEWNRVIERHDDAWRGQHARAWRQEHIRQGRLRDRLEQLRAVTDLGMGRAALELEFGEPATVVDLARRWLDDPGSGSHARFLLGAAQLKNGDRQGADTLESCIKTDPTWALAARHLMQQHASLLATDSLRDRNATLLARAHRKRGRALGQALGLMQQGQLAQATLDDDAWTILRDVFAGVPAVAAAWCAGIDDLVHDQRRYRVVVLILRLHTDRLRDMGLSEDEVCDEARALLGGLLPGSTLRLVWTVYTTEPLAPELHALLTQWAQTGERCCLVQPKEGEAVGPGARAAALR